MSWFSSSSYFFQNNQRNFFIWYLIYEERYNNLIFTYIFLYICTWFFKNDMKTHHKIDEIDMRIYVHSFVSTVFNTMSCHTVFVSKFWNKIDTKLELYRVNCVISFPRERKKLFQLVLWCAYYNKKIVTVLCLRDVLFVLVKNNMTSCRAVFVLLILLSCQVVLKQKHNPKTQIVPSIL